MNRRQRRIGLAPLARLLLGLLLPTITAIAAPPAISREAHLASIAQPLLPTPLSEAAAVLMRDGVVRISDVVSPEQCAALKAHILELRDSPPPAVPDLGCVVGTRLRFTAPIRVDLGYRDDLLLPLQDPMVSHTLGVVLDALAPLLKRCAGPLLTLDTELDAGGSRRRGASVVAGDDEDDLELVELAALIARPGAGHQTAHGDFRRGATEPGNVDRLPPRLVTFLYLQDTPSVEHGPTMFVPGTNTAEAHQRFYKAGPIGGATDDVAFAATLEAGDVAVVSEGADSNTTAHNNSSPTLCPLRPTSLRPSTTPVRSTSAARTRWKGMFGR